MSDVSAPAAGVFFRSLGEEVQEIEIPSRDEPVRVKMTFDDLLALNQRTAELILQHPRVQRSRGQ